MKLKIFGVGLLAISLVAGDMTVMPAFSAPVQIPEFLPIEVLPIAPTDVSAARRGGGMHRAGGYRGGSVHRSAGYRGGAARRTTVARGPHGRTAVRSTTAVRGPRGNTAVRRTTAVGRPGWHGGGVRWARPANYWWRPGAAIAAGAAIGFVTASAAVAYAGAAPGPNMCWYYTDSSRTQGFWDACP